MKNFILPIWNTEQSLNNWREAKFSDIRGWRDNNTAFEGSFSAFQQSCEIIANSAKKRGVAPSKKRDIARLVFSINHHHWLPICTELRHILKQIGNDKPTTAQIRAFFEKNFRPWILTKPAFFTGYFEMQLNVSKVKDAIYRHPILGVPNIDMDKMQYDRERIESLIHNDNVDNKNWPVIYWTDDKIDLFLTHIQGSAILTFRDGGMARIGYAANNGFSYQSIGKYLIDQQEIDKKSATWPTIRRWLENNPSRADAVMQKNPRYIFFKSREIKKGENTSNIKGPLGEYQTILTPRNSLAVDRDIVPYGLPIWVDIKRDDITQKMMEGGQQNNAYFQKLMFAQDTGNAIKGAGRADIFLGHGKEALDIAGNLRHHGTMILLLPKGVGPSL